MPTTQGATHDELGRLASTAEEVAAEHQAAAEEARAMQGELRRGRAWSEVARRRSAGVAARFRNASRRSVELSTAFLTAVARGLSEEGRSRREIAQHLGVSHQRISALLGRRPS